MCDPVSALAIAGIATSTLGVYQQSQTQKAVLGAQATQDQINAEIAQERADETRNVESYNVNQQNEAFKQIRAGQVARLVANGIDPSTGFSSNLLADSAVENQREIDLIRYNANADRRGLQTQGHNFQTQSAITRGRASNINPLFDATSNALVQGGTFADRYYTRKDTQRS